MTNMATIKSDMEQLKQRMATIETQMLSLQQEYKEIHHKLDMMLNQPETKKETHIDVMLSSSFSVEHIVANSKLNELKEYARTNFIKNASGKNKTDIVKIIVAHYQANRNRAER